MYGLKFASFEELLEFEAIQKGLEQGLEQGRKEERRDMVRRLVSRAMGSVPESLAGMIETADARQLQSWCEQLLDGAPPAILFKHSVVTSTGAPSTNANAAIVADAAKNLVTGATGGN